MLGHSSIRVTADVYGHLLEPARAEAAEAMGATVGLVLPPPVRPWERPALG